MKQIVVDLTSLEWLMFLNPMAPRSDMKAQLRQKFRQAGYFDHCEVKLEQKGNILTYSWEE
jgi:hypothetical protein